MADSNSFHYVDFTVAQDHKTVSFNYELTHDGISHRLTETLIFPDALQINLALQRSLRALHLALGISYYKIYLPSMITHSYLMDHSEAEFWNDVFQNGLGEFLYVNKLSASQIARFKAQDGQEFAVQKNLELTQRALLGIGGGKDSIVAGELLKSIGTQVQGFVMATGEQLGQSKAVSDVMGITLNAVGRTLDPQLMNLQMMPGAYKGHIPISLIFGLVGTTLAIASHASMVVVANEASASIPTTEWEGNAVNHQWSKSFSFEQKLQGYIKAHIADGITYFSAIRPLSSVAVAKKFSNYPQYFEVFTSDNYVFRIDPTKRPNGRWSLESPKSLSSYLLLSPWLSEAAMSRTFGIDFLNEHSLEPLFKELTGLEGHPPLDCVGTVDELVVSLNSTYSQGKFLDTYLMGVAKTAGLLKDKTWEKKFSDELKLQPDYAYPLSLTESLLKVLQ